METTTRKKLIGVAAVVAGVGLGSVAGAMVAAPTTSAAVESVEEEGAAPGCHRGALLETAAATIGISAEELRGALREGSTVAEVAEANGVEPQEVVDALVAEVSAHIDERVAAGELDAETAEARKAELPERMEALVEGERPWRSGPRRPPFRR